MPTDLRKFECTSCGSTHKALTPNKNTRNKQSHQTVNKVSKTSEQFALEVFEEKKNLSNRFSDKILYFQVDIKLSFQLYF